MKKLFDEFRDEPSKDFVIDYNNEIKNIDDILKIQPAHFHIDAFFENEDLILSVIGNVDLTLACAKTLKPVEQSIHIKTSIVIADHEEADFMLDEDIELHDILFGTIIAEKPYVVYHPDAKELSFEEKKSPHPAFADLDKLFEK